MSVPEHRRWSNGENAMLKSSAINIPDFRPTDLVSRFCETQREYRILLFSQFWEDNAWYFLSRNATTYLDSGQRECIKYRECAVRWAQTCATDEGTRAECDVKRKKIILTLSATYTRHYMHISGIYYSGIHGRAHSGRYCRSVAITSRRILIIPSVIPLNKWTESFSLSSACSFEKITSTQFRNNPSCGIQLRASGIALMTFFGV